MPDHAADQSQQSDEEGRLGEGREGAGARWRNWSGALSATPAQWAEPADEAALAALMAHGSRPIRVTGAGHSFTPLCVTDGTLVDIGSLSGIYSHDPVTQTVRVGAGTNIHALGQPLFDRGLGLINQGDIDRQTIAGAVSTGTHGTGLGLGAIATAVKGLRLVSARGEVIVCDREREPEIFEAARLSLGAVGVISELTLQCRRAYKLAERSWVMQAEQCLSQLDDLARATRHFEFMWFPYSQRVVAKSLAETDAPAPAPLGATGDGAEQDAIGGDEELGRILIELARKFPMITPALNRVVTAAVSGRADKEAKIRWSHEAFPSPRNLAFNEMEYAVPAEDGPDCVRTLIKEIRQRRINVALPIEYRFIAADDLWLSPFHGRASVSISVHQYWKQPYEGLFDVAEGVFRSFNGRPHWGKIHSLTARDFEALYPKWPDFLAVRDRLDPEGIFLNPHLRSVFGV